MGMESVACNLCRRETTTRRLTSVDRVSGESFDILRCSHCGLWFTSPRPTPDEMAAYYPEPVDPSRPAQFLRRWLRRRRALWSAAGLPPGRALEIGCGAGWMLDALREVAWEVVGTERCQQSAARARSLGLDVCVGEPACCGFATKSFDLVILWHVLEHLRDPPGTLVEVHRLMRPSGRLVIAVPNIDSWQARVAGRSWVHLDVPRHLYHFNATTLDLMLRSAGFQIRTWSSGVSAYECRGWWELLNMSTAFAPAAHVLAILAAPFVAAFSAVAAHRKAGATMIVRARSVPDKA